MKIENNVRIIVDNVFENDDESGAYGLWDLAHEIVIDIANQPKDTTAAETIYNALTSLAVYTLTE